MLKDICWEVWLWSRNDTSFNEWLWWFNLDWH